MVQVRVGVEWKKSELSLEGRVGVGSGVPLGW